MICQLEEGLSSYGLLQEVRKNPDLFSPIFVSGNLFTLTPDEFLDNLFVRWSEKQAERHVEENTFKYFCDVVDFLHHAGNIKNTLKANHLSSFLKVLSSQFSAYLLESCLKSQNKNVIICSLDDMRKPLSCKFRN